MIDDQRIEINVRLFGAFRKFGDSQSIAVTVPGNATAADLKVKLAELLNADDLVAKSALADETKVLQDHETLRGRPRLAVLPPVCGG